MLSHHSQLVDLHSGEDIFAPLAPCGANRGCLRKDTKCVIAPRERQCRIALAGVGQGVAFDEVGGEGCSLFVSVEPFDKLRVSGVTQQLKEQC